MAERLDKALVTAGLVSSRSRAHQLIASGQVEVGGVVVRKPAAKVQPGAQLQVTDGDLWVSRAAHKLLGALEAFEQISPEGKRCLDAGASTGGFTQVLLSRGAEHVVAADVGRDQLAEQLRTDPRVTTVEGINLRYVQPGELGEPFELIVADLSFISLRLVVQALAGQAAGGADLLLMVKPQFEIGRERLSRTGVVSSPDQRREAVEGVITAAEEAGLWPRGIARSQLPGQDGNAEFFLWLQREPAEAISAVGDRLGSVEFGD
ncbi:TlyA family RNA methyltransferase [Nesterenkonia ebinurensis]|uniref:TlyA family RNA methyltransferase n=1 Tax=Nesterenkonia ebinurensis TaxID=2608252 RepID=UPI00123D29DD|nr:TlyA family RNA methyltransferase [Nesterenkonia ebinurensis]